MSNKQEWVIIVLLLVILGVLFVGDEDKNEQVVETASEGVVSDTSKPNKMILPDGQIFHLEEDGRYYPEGASPEDPLGIL